MDSFMKIWQSVLDYCRTKVNETVYNLWISPLKPISFENNTIKFYINDEFTRSIILEKYLPLLNDAFEQVMGFNVMIHITTDESELN